MTMAAAASKQGTILGCLSAAHLLPRPKEWKETITLKKKTEKGQKNEKEERHRRICLIPVTNMDAAYG